MQVGPLTQTAWSQGAPYNNFCPLKSYGYERAPAGCVAIAGAQMLYYLHYKLGTPDSIPSSATCSGYVPYNYTMWQGDYSSTQWNLMPNHGNSSDGLYAAPLITNIGYKLVMQYGNIVSTANTYELPSLVFLPYGISCEYSSINYDTVYNSLLDSIPLIARAGYIDGINGHAFIIDGYQSRRDVTTYVYKWHPAFIPPSGSPILKADSLEFVYSEPYPMIHMNWGDDPDYNSTWSAPTGSWIYDNNNYNINRSIIHHFRRRE